MSSTYFRWLIFSCDLWSLYFPVHFLSMWLSSIRAITSSNGYNVSPRNIPYYYCYYYYPPCEFLIPADLSLKSEWQVFSYVLDSSRNPGRSQQYHNLDCVDSSSDFCITITLMFHSFLSSLARSKYLVLFSLSLIFTLQSDGKAKSNIRKVLFFFFYSLIFFH